MSSTKFFISIWLCDTVNIIATCPWNETYICMEQKQVSSSENSKDLRKKDEDLWEPLQETSRLPGIQYFISQLSVFLTRASNEPGSVALCPIQTNFPVSQGRVYFPIRGKNSNFILLSPLGSRNKQIMISNKESVKKRS